jgi:hypothetical protein
MRGIFPTLSVLLAQYHRHIPELFCGAGVHDPWEVSGPGMGMVERSCVGIKSEELESGHVQFGNNSVSASHLS